MRAQMIFGFFCLVTLTGFGPNGCDNPELMLEAVDDGPCTQPEAPEAVFTLTLGEDVLAERTAMVSLEAQCLDEMEGFVFSADSQNFGSAELEGLEAIDLLIPYGNHPTATTCFVLLRQNEQMFDDAGAPNPGFGTYTIGDLKYDAPVVPEGPFAGHWKVDLRPDPTVD